MFARERREKDEMVADDTAGLEPRTTYSIMFNANGYKKVLISEGLESKHN